MKAAKDKPCIFVISEDDRDRQIARGFQLHGQVLPRRIDVHQMAGGWAAVLDKFKSEYIAHLRNNPLGYVVLLIDFDGKYAQRRQAFDQEVPHDLKDRVFVLGARTKPEDLRKALGKDYEPIGLALAEDCFLGTDDIWGNEELAHNTPDRNRLMLLVKQFLFESK